MKIGTKSVLFGAHQFLIHPLFLARAWWILYGLPWSPKLWIAFFVHDLGYIGKLNMDGDEGEQHPYLGARIMGWLFGPEWFDFSLYHSRFLAKQHDRTPSSLCAADKLATALEPSWLYLPRVWLTGELIEYMSLAGHKPGSKYSKDNRSDEITELLKKETPSNWHRAMTISCRRWAFNHRNSVLDYSGILEGNVECACQLDRRR